MLVSWTNLLSTSMCDHWEPLLLPVCNTCRQILNRLLVFVMTHLPICGHVGAKIILWRSINVLLAVNGIFGNINLTSKPIPAFATVYGQQGTKWGHTHTHTHTHTHYIAWGRNPRAVLITIWGDIPYYWGTRVNQFVAKETLIRFQSRFASQGWQPQWCQKIVSVSVSVPAYKQCIGFLTLYVACSLAP